MVKSSTNLAWSICGGLRPLIIMTNHHGPSLVPCGTPAGTLPHSEKQSFAILTRCFLSLRKSIIQLRVVVGIHRGFSFDTKMVWSI
jgi:hypothetical protein